MTNYEKFKDELIPMFANQERVALAGGVPKSCSEATCQRCEFNNFGYSCKDSRERWLNAEYVEPPQLTKQEMAFLVALNPSFQYVARDKRGELTFFRTKPEINPFLEKWSVCVQQYETPHLSDFAQHCMSFMKDQNLFAFRFDFIKWGDKEPWSIKELLKFEVIDDDN